MSAPFGFQSKWRLGRHWTLARPALSRSALRVYILLLDHCNPQTRRCDPSMARLAGALDLTRRSVQSAINELRKRRAIVVVGRVGSRNKYGFHLPANEIKIGRSVVKSTSRYGEGSFQNPAKLTSPEKRKEKKKKKDAYSKSRLPCNKAIESRVIDYEVGTARHHERFLNDVSGRLRQLGLSEDVLIAVDSKVPEKAYQAACEGTLSRQAAIEDIIDACLEIIERSS